MSKTTIFIAMLFPSVAFAALHPVAPGMHTQQPEQRRSESALGAHGGAVFDRLSMGLDLGGHTGATVTPDITKTGQPTADRPGGANQSSESSATGSCPGAPRTNDSLACASRAPDKARAAPGRAASSA